MNEAGPSSAISAAVLPEWDQEIPKTRTCLERIPAGDLDRGPHPKSMTFRHLGTHLANIPNWGHLTLLDDHFELEPPGGESTRVEPRASVEAILEWFDTAAAKARAAIVAATDEAWHGEWSLKHGGHVLFTLPRVAVFRNMVMNHLIHHRGQLSVYLRLHDVPVPALYGPSADEGIPGMP